MKTKNKINLIIIAAMLCVAAMIYVLNTTIVWNKYSRPITEKNVILGTYFAEDYAIDGTLAHYYQIRAVVKYSQASWPKVDMQVLKSDTILLLHNCSGD